MSLIKKPSELEVNPVMSAMIYGMPGAGKTTLACSAPSPVLFDFDGGVNRIKGVHQVDTVQVHSWEEALEALSEVERHPEYRTVVIDTVGKMLLYMEDYIKRTQAPRNPALTQRDGSLAIKGYGVRKQMFIDFNNRLKMSGRHIVYVAHEVEKTRKVDKDEVTVKRPDIPGSSINDLIKELDLMGYVQLYGNRRVISFDPQEAFYAKNSCGMAGVIDIPSLFDEKGDPVGNNDFFQRVIASFKSRLDDNKRQAVAFDKICTEIRANAAEIANADDANNFVKWVTGLEHVFNSKSVALQALNAKVAELGLKYDKTTKTYSDGTAG